MRVIGIDPGSRYTGFGVVEKVGHELTHVASGRINASARTLSFGARLSLIYAGLDEVIAEYLPEHSAIESIFSAKNVSSTIKLGQARGVALLVLEHRGLSPTEYSPAEVKNNVTGHGRASKASVDIMIRRLLKLPDEANISEDAADALAVALCHCQLIGFKQKLESPNRS